METAYLISAVFGGTILFCQFVMTLWGLSGDHDIASHDIAADHDAAHDVHHDAHSSWFVGILTFRTLVAAVTFFGLAGMIATSARLAPTSTIGIAVSGGIAAMFLVAYLMRGLTRLKADGTIRISRAVGARGTVYLTVPGYRSGTGKVTLTLQNRTMEFPAITSHEELPTGTKVVAVAVIGSGTIEVAPAAVPEGVTHV